MCVLQAANKNVAKVPPPVPTKPKQISLPYFGQTNQSPSDSKPDGNPQQLSAAVPASVGSKPKPAGPQPRVLLGPGAPSLGQDQALAASSKQESPPAAAVRPFTPQPSKDSLLPPFRKPPTVAASSIYSMYTQQQAPGKNFQQAVQSTLTKTHTRGPHFPSGKGAGLASTRQGTWVGPTPGTACRQTVEGRAPVLMDAAVLWVVASVLTWEFQNVSARHGSVLQGSWQGDGCVGGCGIKAPSALCLAPVCLCVVGLLLHCLSLI